MYPLGFFEFERDKDNGFGNLSKDKYTKIKLSKFMRIFCGHQVTSQQSSTIQAIDKSLMNKCCMCVRDLLLNWMNERWTMPVWSVEHLLFLDHKL